MAIKKLVMDFETTKGQDPSSPKPIYLNPAGETGIGITRQTKSDEVIGGDIDSGSEVYGTFNEISGTTNIPMSYERVGFIMKAMFGAPSTVDNGDGTYTHTFTSMVDCLPTFLFQESGDECGNGLQVDRYNGLIAKSIQLSVSPDGDYNIAFSYVGMKHRDSVIDGITELDETNKIVTDVTRIKNDHASILIDGSTFGVAKDFSLTYDRNSVAEHFIGSGLNAGDVHVGAAKLNGSISTLFDTNIYTKAKNEQTLSAELQFTSGSNSLKIAIGEFKMKFKRDSKKLGEKYAINADFEAFKKSGTELVKVTLTNAISQY